MMKEILALLCRRKFPRQGSSLVRYGGYGKTISEERTEVLKLLVN